MPPMPPLPTGGMLAAIGTGAAALGAAYVAYKSMFTVPGGHRAVVWNRLTGMEKEIRSEGLFFVLPFIQYPTLYDIRVRPTPISTLTGSKDLQMVNITLRVLHRPQPARLPDIYMTLGPDSCRAPAFLAIGKVVPGSILPGATDTN